MFFSSLKTIVKIFISQQCKYLFKSKYVYTLLLVKFNNILSEQILIQKQIFI